MKKMNNISSQLSTTSGLKNQASVMCIFKSGATVTFETVLTAKDFATIWNMRQRMAKIPCENDGYIYLDKKKICMIKVDILP